MGSRIAGTAFRERSVVTRDDRHWSSLAPA